MAQILLIDDDDVFRNVVRHILERAGHSVQEASNGRQAVPLLEGPSLPELVVTDLLMPQMDGLELLHYVRRTGLDIKVLAMSGGGRLGTEDLLRAAMQLGANSAIAKPFSGTDLLRIVATLLAERADARLPIQ